MIGYLSLAFAMWLTLALGSVMLKANLLMFPRLALVTGAIVILLAWRADVRHEERKAAEQHQIMARVGR